MGMFNNKRFFNRRFGNSSAGGAAYDADAQAFFDAVVSNGGTISAASKGYVNTFVLAAKSNNYWSKLLRINLFCGDQLAAALVPLKIGGGGSTDSNNNFTGGSYSEATGLTGNGTTQYLDTALNANTLTAHNTSFGVYNRSSTSNGGRHGATNSGDTFSLYAPFSDGVFYGDMYDSTGGAGRLSAATGGTPYGFLVDTRRASNDHEIYRNGASLASNATSGGSLPNANIYIFAKSNPVNEYVAGILGAYFIGTSLTDTDVSNFNTDLEAFQDSLGRGVQ